MGEGQGLGRAEKAGGGGGRDHMIGGGGAETWDM